MRAILTNAWYTRHEVWNRQRRDYELLDPTAPADGHVRRMRWNSTDAWIWSPEPNHDPIVARDEWQRVQATMTTMPRAPRTSDVTYLLRGRVLCTICGRRMTGQTQSHRRKYYRCEFRRARPGIAIEDHPNDVYVREAALVEALDTWLDDLFAPDRAHMTARLVVEADERREPAHHAAAQEAREQLQHARQRLVQYRRALDDGADPATVASWITEAAAAGRAAEANIRAALAGAPQPLDEDSVLETIRHFGNLTGLLAEANPKDRASPYEALNVTATYDANTRTAVLDIAIPRSAESVSEGGLERPLHPWPPAASHFL